MKVMFASDVHGSLYYANLMIEAFKKEKADRLIILGDILYHGPRNALPENYNPNEVAELLNRHKEKIIAIKGNCDSEVDQMVLEFDMMQPHSHLLIDGRHFFLTHGHKYNPEKLPQIETGSILVYGHTHKLMLKEESNLILLNPGSISIPKGENPNSYAIYEGKEIKIKTFDDISVCSMNL